MTTATMTIDFGPYKAALTSIHQHLCPKQVLGVRAGLHAGDLLGITLPHLDKRLFAFVETDGCFTDGIVVATGCAAGHRTIRHMDYGKVAATFVDTLNGRAIRICPTIESRQRAWAYAPGALDAWHAQLDAYQTMPAEELLDVVDVQLTVSLQAILSEPGLRVQCARCGEDVINGRHVEQAGLTLCRPCAGEAYYARIDT
ncbi:MAG: TraR/DksA C4-type zinc finger protein [Chloroflexi bacterium]|nr:TraR/DksA C4-type zinc finger protein [Chloroflexota bacterium]